MLSQNKYYAILKSNKLYIGIIMLKILNVIIAFLTIKVLVNRLPVVEYGFVIALVSIFNIFSLFDFGLVSSLRNKLTEVIINRKKREARLLISSVYSYYIFIALTILIIFIPVIGYTNFNYFFSNFAFSDNLTIKYLFFINLLILLSRLILSVINAVFHAFNQSYLVDLINLLVSMFILIGIFVIKDLNSLKLCLITFIVQTLVFIISTIYYFLINNIRFPVVSYKLLKHVNGLKNASLHFFFIQFGVYLLYSTDSILIAHFFSGKEVIQHNISFRYFNVITFFWAAILTPFWSFVSNAYCRGDLNAIKNQVNKLLKLWVLITLCSTTLLIFSIKVFHLWLGNDILIPMQLNVLQFIFVSVASLCAIFSNVLNGINNLKRQSITIVIVAVFNLVFSVLCVVVFKFSFISIITMTCLGQFILLLVNYKQYKFFLNKTQY